MSSEQNHCIKPLNGLNYSTWSEEIKALLNSKGLWRVVDGKEPCPAKNDAGEHDKWDAKADKTAGEIMLNVEADQRVHIRATQDNPVNAWKALESIYL